MRVGIQTPAANAYRYPLLIKQLLHTSRATASRQEIVYRAIRRHAYQDLIARIGWLASGLSNLKLEQGRGPVGEGQRRQDQQVLSARRLRLRKSDVFSRPMDDKPWPERRASGTLGSEWLA